MSIESFDRPYPTTTELEEARQTFINGACTEIMDPSVYELTADALGKDFDAKIVRMRNAMKPVIESEISTF